MRFCPHCRRLNPGRPMICHYCGRTWQVRLCPRGHENPSDSQFCGICGSADLSETAGPVPFWIWLIRIASLIIFIVFIASLRLPEFHLTDQINALVIAITILLVGINMALSILPGQARKIVMMVTKTAKGWFIRAVAWCWERVKIMLS
jgi:RNA polymerase subunit RPABC4/transcription elongation factor Spt4